MTRKQQIGFSQRIQFNWLEYTTNLILAGNSRNEIAVALGERLREQLSVGNNPERGNRDKAITILTKVWVTVPEEFQSLRDEGLELLKRLNGNDRMLVHWCMCMAVYPFFSKVAEATGRLLRLQGTVAAAQVQLRVREQLGERETVSRAARRVLRVFIDWGALLETQNKGIYRGAAKRTVDDSPLGIWVIKGILLARGAKLQSVPGMLRDNRLFPFDIASPSLRDLEDCKAFEITRHGLDYEVMLSLASTNAFYVGSYMMTTEWLNAPDVFQVGAHQNEPPRPARSRPSDRQRFSRPDHGIRLLEFYLTDTNHGMRYVPCY